MFNTSIYTERRIQLKKAIKNGLVLLPGNDESSMNYSSNTYHFRQDSNFLYYFGLDSSSLAAVIDVESGDEIIFGDDITLDDIIWMGPQKSMKERAAEVGVNKTLPLAQLKSYINQAVSNGRKIHVLPPYRGEHVLLLAELLVCRPQDVKQFISPELIRAVVNQREIKSPEEISEIEKAHATTYQMQVTAMKNARPGIIEADLAGKLEGIALASSAGVSFPIILSVHGEILHNHHHANELKDGDLMVVDCGAESRLHYAADITRTIPVSGRFTSQQKDIYQIVLKANEKAIEAMKPGVQFKDIHLLSAAIIAGGMKDLGFMTGDIDELIAAGAHALFFPHGLGHQMGIDVHDMESLGEDYVGYDEKVSRSDQFGLAYLRMAKALKPGIVMTVEPGIYFIPALIRQWKNENMHSNFINYDAVEKYLDFGGIRIEDDVLITDQGFRMIGTTIPRSVAEVEQTCQSGK